MFSIFFIVGFAAVVGMGLAIFATRQALPGNNPLVPPEDDAARDAGLPAVSLAQLHKLGEKLCAENGLTVRDRIDNSVRESIWICESKNEFFYGNYVLAFSLVDSEHHQYITLSELLEFKDFVKSVSSTKGFFFTNGYFSRDVHQMLEGPKVALFNKRKVLEDLKNHGLT